MNSTLASITRITAPILVLLLGWLGFQAIGQRPDQEVREAEDAGVQLVRTVRTDTAETLELTVDGSVVPYREIALAAEVAGRVTYKLDDLTTGRFVSKGTKLLEIDTEVHDIARQRVEAEWEQAKIDLQEIEDVEKPNLAALLLLSKRKRELAANELSRVRKLQRDGVATMSVVETAEQSDLQAQNDLTTLENQVRVLETRSLRLAQAVKVARAHLASAERDLARATVVAPIDGVVVQDDVELDGFVQKGAPLFVIEDTSKVEVLSNFTQHELAWVLRDVREFAATTQPPDPESPPMTSEKIAAAERNRAYQLPPIPVTVSFDLAGRSYEWDGTFSRYDGIGLDERTRTVPLRIEVADPTTYRVDGTTGDAGHGPRALMRGMFVTVRTRIEPGTPLLRFPERAMQPGGDVWRAVDGPEGGTLLDICPVTVAWREEGWVYVAANGSRLTANDPLVVSPLSNPEPGAALAIDREGDHSRPGGSKGTATSETAAERPAERPVDAGKADDGTGNAATDVVREGGRS